MTDRWRPNAEDDPGRTPSPDDRRQSRATPRREERTHGPDGGLDTGRGVGRIGVPRSDPRAGERGAADNAGRETVDIQPPRGRRRSRPKAAG